MAMVEPDGSTKLGGSSPCAYLTCCTIPLTKVASATNHVHVFYKLQSHTLQLQLWRTTYVHPTLMLSFNF